MEHFPKKFVIGQKVYYAGEILTISDVVQSGHTWLYSFKETNNKYTQAYLGAV